MSKLIDMTGWVMSEHGVPDSRLTVLQRVEDHVTSGGQRSPQWLCECSCGEHKQIVARGANIRNGITKSCGCLQIELGVGIKKHNDVVLNLQDEHGLYGIGYCFNTGSKFYFDMDDYDKIKSCCWCEDVGSDGYHTLRARESNTNQIIRMSYLILGKFCDHIDRNPLNNRKHNLRIATAEENARNHNKQKNNTSGVTGVCWHKRDCVWVAVIVVNKQRVYLGGFSDKRDAIVKRLNAEKTYFKEFAPQRHLFKEYGILDQ